jgi:hypothetical protein
MAVPGREIDEDDQRRIRKLIRDIPGGSNGRGRLGGVSNAARIVGVSRPTARKYAREVEIQTIKKKFG